MARLLSFLFRLLPGGAVTGRQIVSIPIARIRGEGFQPRLSLEVGRFEALRRSIDEYGVIEPLLLRRTHEGKELEVVCGHRRLLAARQLEMPTVPGRIVELTEREALGIRLTENLHRDALAPLELAEAFERYFLTLGEGTREELGASLGLAEEVVANLAKVLQASPLEREQMIYGGSTVSSQPSAANGPTASAAADLRRLAAESWRRTQELQS